jgi:hypothetical protein
MNWARILAYVTGTVDQELLLRNEYLAAENPLGQKIEAVEGIVPVPCSLVGRCAAIGMMRQRIADPPHFCSWLLRTTLAKTGAA